MRSRRSSTACLEQGIPVVTYNTDNPDSNRLAFAGQDLEQSGYEAAKVLADLIGGEGDVIITTLDAAAQWSIDRETGAQARLCRVSRHQGADHGQHRHRAAGDLLGGRERHAGESHRNGRAVAGVLLDTGRTASMSSATA